MANIKELASFIAKWEGEYVNDPHDSGGLTNKGVTLKTWKKVGYDKNGDNLIDEADLVLITPKDVIEVVLKPHYWDFWKADQIQNQSVANLVVDWMWMSGRRSVFIVQKIVGVQQDGIVGPNTLIALNNHPDQAVLFDQIKAARVNDIQDLCVKYPKNLRFKRGWLNRISEIKFVPLILLIFFLVNLSSCRTAKQCNHSVENNTTEYEQEKIMDKQQASSAKSDLTLSTVSTDSITETIVITFEPSCINGKQINPIERKGMAVISRHKKVRTEVLNTNQQIEARQENDTSYIKSSFVESGRKQLQTKQIPVWDKVFLVGLLIVLIAFNVYFIFYFRK